MSLIWVGLVAVSGLAGFVAWNARGRGAWRRVAERLGLRFTEESYWLKWGIEGRLRGCAVRLVNTSKGRQISSVLTIQRSPPIDPALTIRAESLATRAKKLVLGQDVLIGDPAFDAAIWMDGPPLKLFALLDARTRATLQRVIAEWRVELEGGALHLETTRIITDGERLERLLLDCTTLAERLAPPRAGYLQAALATLDGELDGRVRLACLGHLLDGPAEWALPAARIGMRDADAGARLRSALVAGAEGIATLEALLDGGGLDEPAAERALAAVHAHAPDRIRARVEGILASRPAASTGPAIRLAGTLGMRAQLPRIVRLAELSRLHAPVVDALRLFGDPAGEPALISAVGNSDVEVRRRAIDALGHFGTRAAIAPLRAITDRATRGVAAQAIARISQREAPGRGGGLSMVDDAHGALSTAGGPDEASEDA